MSNVWAYVRQTITVGQTIHDGRYRVTSIGDKRFVMERVQSGKTVNISRKMCESVMARLMDGVQFRFQANASDGGFSYTAAICHGVAAALDGLMLRDAGIKRFILASNASAALKGVA